MEQIEQFELFVPRSPTMREALEARDVGMAKVEENAGETFSDRAAAFILTYLHVHGDSAGEDITDACKDAGIVPHNDKAFGPVYLKLCRQKLIFPSGNLARRKGHGAMGGRIWSVFNNTTTKPN